MKKFLKGLICAALGGSMIFSVACNTGGGISADRPLNLSIGALDGNFNPFFYTTANDGEVVGMTQASLIGVTNDGEVAVGDDYPVVAQSYTRTFFTTKTGGTGLAESTDEVAKNGRTEYDFLIKNGMTFSNGSPLTIKDVLFNFYVYLDPAYTGSNTMYSVDIQGLAAYQYNDDTRDDGNTDNSEFASLASQRIQDIVNWSTSQPGAKNPDTDEQLKADIALVDSLFLEELTSDWSAVETSWQTTYEVNFSFKYAWQAYLYQEGLIQVQERKNDDGTTYQIRVDKDGNEIQRYGADGKETEAYKNGKNLTTLDPFRESVDGHATEVGMIGAQAIIDEIAEATTDTLIAQYIADNEVDMGSKAENEAYAYLMLTKEYCIDKVHQKLDTQTGYEEVVLWWATASSAYNAFFADERGKALANSQHPRYYISGIQTYKTSTFDGMSLGEEHDVLKIVINGVDPAAIWNFGVSIAPLYYYSGTYKSKNYVTSFNGDQNGGRGDGANACFGVERGDWNFFEQVIKVNKSALPVGAGVYKASNNRGNPTSDGNQFKNNNIVYFQRNDYFETMGKNINNAKIKYLRYKVMEDDRIIPSLQSGAIDYGQPNATPTNFKMVNGSKTFEAIDYPTNGYGYVGINPTYVPDIEIRRMIMRAMDPADSLSYYGDLASPIYRPMSTTSWAYPQGASTYDGLEIMDSAAAIKTALENKGYRDSNRDGSFEDRWGNELKYTFTIAGANTDHPAYKMFAAARDLLNQSGCFKIEISTSANALKDLAQGTLAIWAAAYSTAIDPDMYQVYHKDSQATSVLNWGYRTIYNDGTGKYTVEKSYINELSEKIEEARKTLSESRRKTLYSEALDIVMDLAIQLPLYQRQDLCVFNKNVIDVKTVNQKADHINGVLARIWEVDYVK